MFMTVTDSIQRAVIGSIGTLLCAGLCVAGAAGPAEAAETTAARTLIVSSADLNLANPAGRAALDRRIKTAAESVCRTGLDDVGARRAENRCVRDAVVAATPVTQG